MLRWLLCSMALGRAAADPPPSSSSSEGESDSAESAGAGSCFLASGDCSNSADYPDCVDAHDTCAEWARAGECDHNPAFMVTGCPAACGSCHLRSFDARCKRKAGQTAVLSQPGDLARLLAHATSPAFAHLQPRVVHTDPTVIVFDAFLTPAEAAALALEAGHDFKPSAEGGALDENGALAELDGQKDARRTSESSFCTAGCDAAPIVSLVQARVGNLTGIAKPNFEFIQAVKYREGQRYVQVPYLLTCRLTD